MKEKYCVAIVVCLLALPVLVGGQEASRCVGIVPGEVPVKVKYQFQRTGSNSWTTGTTILTGATTESMMQNQIGARHPGYNIRILAAETGSSNRMHVRYQFKSQNGYSWTYASVTLNGALTENMARNQLLARHPGYDIRILSMNTSK